MKEKREKRIKQGTHKPDINYAKDLFYLFTDNKQAFYF
jgi:hypothetical protein